MPCLISQTQPSAQSTMNFVRVQLFDIFCCAKWNNMETQTDYLIAVVQ